MGGYLKHCLGVFHCLPAPGRTGQFSRIVSRKIELSRKELATSFLPKGIGMMSAVHSLPRIPSTGAPDLCGSRHIHSANGNWFVR
jgi:hypothetical protein